MSKRSRGPGRSTSTRRARPVRGPRRDEPDLIRQIARMLADDDPLALLALASTLLAVVDPRTRNPFEPDDAAPDRDELLESFFGVRRPEISALLTAVAALSGDDLLRRRVHNEVGDRGHPLPHWLAAIADTPAGPRTVELTHVLGDGDNLLLTADLPGGRPLTAVVYVDHNLGTVVKDAFVLPEPLDDVLAALSEAAADDPDMTARSIAPADARAKIVEAVELGAMVFPPLESDTWPSCRALVEWMAELLPAGGAGYDQTGWNDAAIAELARRFRASRHARTVPDPTDLVTPLLHLGAQYPPCDPLRMSPVVVELLLLDRIPRTVMAPAAELAAVPDVLRALVRFCHDERGIRPELTEETVAAVTALEPEFRTLITDDRSGGALGLDGLDEDDLDLAFRDLMLAGLHRSVGGPEALDRLDADPLPDEPFDTAAVPADVRARVEEVRHLVDRCCADLFDAEYRTACRRLLVDVAAADPAILRRGKPTTAAAAICWLTGKSNGLFDREPDVRTMAAKDLLAHFGVSNGTVSQRSEPMLRALGVEPLQYGRKELGSIRYLTGPRRAQILALRDRYRGDERR